MRSILKSSMLTFVLAVSAIAQERTPLNLASADLDGEQRWAYYCAIIREFSGASPADELWVIGLRGLRNSGSRHDSALNSGGYDDTLVVVNPTSASVIEFSAATHAGLARSVDCPFGVDQLRPGRYLATPGDGAPPNPVWRIATGDGVENLPVWRDRDGSGHISSEEQAFDEHYGTTANGLLFHDGLDGERPQSVGGQTLAPADFKRFVEAVGRRRRFHYLLLDANSPRVDSPRDLKSLPTPLTLADPFRYYEKVALRSGVRPGFPLLVIALRGLAPNGHRHVSAENVGPYNDTFLVLKRGDERPSIRAFLGSLHAGQRSTSRWPGIYAGVAQVRPGLYYARSNDRYHGLWSWHIVRQWNDSQGDLPAWRDTDKDGVLSSAEKRAAEVAGVTADEILIHNGLDRNTGSSIGCFTMPAEILTQFIDDVGPGSSFPFLLLDANEALDR